MANILGIDRGSKVIGTAYMNAEEKIPMPLGYVNNDGDTYFTLGGVIMSKNISTIVIGYPRKQKNIQEKIDKFIKALSFIIDPEKTSIEKMNEDYSTVEAGEIISNFKKNLTSDTVSAMVILERYAKKSE